MPTDAETGARLRGFGSATLGESGARIMAPRIVPAWRGARVGAPAFPVRCTTGDNLAIHVAAAQAPSGSVLVVDVGEVADYGYWGEVLTTGAQARGIAGLVIDGGVRDIEAIETLGFPVFASTIALRGASKNQPGAVNIPIDCGGAATEGGDWVVGDADGVVVVPGRHLDTVLRQAAERAKREVAMFEALRAGTTTVQLLELDTTAVRSRASD